MLLQRAITTCYYHVLLPRAVTTCYYHVLLPRAITTCYYHVLVFQSLDACYRWGINEGRVNVLDTYVYLLSHYNETLPYDSQEFDVEFSVYPHLQVNLLITLTGK